MTVAKIAPLDQVSLRDSAYRALRDAFIRGQFAPGEVLSLRALAEQLRISMTPVREAVRRLVAEGALIDTQSRTLVVPAFDARRMADLKSARLAMEMMVLDQAADRLGDADIARLRAILEAPSEGPAGLPDLGQNYAFHFGLYRLSGSEVLLPIVEALWVQYGAYLNLIIHHPAVRDTDEHKFHFAIVAALERGDRDGARAALRADIERSFNIIPAQGETDPAPRDG